MLNERRQAIVSLLANTSAVSRQLTGLVADNEKELAPTLERLNRVNAMLEKNRDNMAKALPGLREIPADTGRDRVERRLLQRVASPTSQPAQLLQPFLDYAFGFRRGVDAGQPPDNAGPRAELAVPRQRHSATRRPAAAMNRKRSSLSRPSPWSSLLVAGAAFLVRQIVLRAQDHHRVSSRRPPRSIPATRCGSPASRSARSTRSTPEGTQTKMTLNVDHDVPIPADAKAVIVAQNLVAARYVQLTPAYRKGGGPTMADGAVIPATAPRCPSSGMRSRPS